MSMLDRRKKKKYKVKELGWAKWFGVAMAILTVAVIAAEIIELAGMA